MLVALAQIIIAHRKRQSVIYADPAEQSVNSLNVLIEKFIPLKESASSAFTVDQAQTSKSASEPFVTVNKVIPLKATARAAQLDNLVRKIAMVLENVKLSHNADGVKSTNVEITQ